jgi:hypothetical protein
MRRARFALREIRNPLEIRQAVRGLETVPVPAADLG